MSIDRDFVSPDGQLRFLLRFQDGDSRLGFDGVPSHTHGGILAAETGSNLDDAIEAYIGKLIANESIIAIAKVDGKIRDIWITENPAEEFHYCPPDETINFRLWDGTQITL